MTTEQRLERLERKGRWMWWLCFGPLALALASAALAHTVRVNELMEERWRKVEQSRHLEVRSLKVKDKDGKVRFGLTTGAGQALMKLVGKDGKSGVYVVSTSAGAAGVNVLGKDGRARAMLGTEADGAPSLELRDTDGKVLWKAPKD